MHGHDLPVSTRRSALSPLSAARGMTTVELAMVLLIISVTVGLGAVVASTSISRAESAESTQQMALMLALTQRFVIANNRAPCPDRNGDGQEQCLALGNPGAAQLGLFPFRTLGLGSPVVDGQGQPIRYGANPSLQAPGTVTLASWDFPSGALDRFCAALRTRLTGGFDASELAVAPVGQSSCTASNGAFNPAVVFVSAGGDQDNSGDRFDGALNRAAVRAGGLCVDNPGRAVASGYDDQVRAIGLSELNGLLCMKGRDSFDGGLNAGGGSP